MNLALQLFANGVWIGLNYAVLAATFGMIFRACRVFHFAHGAVYTLAAYILSRLQHLPGSGGLAIVLALLVTGCVAGAAGALIDQCIYRPMRRRARASSLMAIVASLGLTFVIQNSLAVGFGSGALGLDFPVGISSVTIGPVFIPSIEIWGAPALAALLVVLWWVNGKTTLGRWGRAVGANRDLVETIGISSNAVLAAIFFIASAGLALPALMIGSTAGVYPEMGDLPMLFAIMAVIFGGMTSYVGWVVGGLLIGIFVDMAPLWVNTAWSDAIAFLLVTVLMMVFPRGLLGGRAGRYL